jgi:hypothetical protein
MDRRVNSAPRTGIQFARKKQKFSFSLVLLAVIFFFHSKYKIILSAIDLWKVAGFDFLFKIQRFTI